MKIQISVLMSSALVLHVHHLMIISLPLYDWRAMSSLSSIIESCYTLSEKDVTGFCVDRRLRADAEKLQRNAEFAWGWAYKYQIGAVGSLCCAILSGWASITNKGLGTTDGRWNRNRRALLLFAGGCAVTSAICAVFSRLSSPDLTTFRRINRQLQGLAPFLVQSTNTMAHQCKRQNGQIELRFHRSDLQKHRHWFQEHLAGLPDSDDFRQRYEQQLNELAEAMSNADYQDCIWFEPGKLVALVNQARLEVDKDCPSVLVDWTLLDQAGFKCAEVLKIQHESQQVAQRAAAKCEAIRTACERGWAELNEQKRKLDAEFAEYVKGTATQIAEYVKVTATQIMDRQMGFLQSAIDECQNVISASEEVEKKLRTLAMNGEDVHARLEVCNTVRMAIAALRQKLEQELNAINTGDHV